MSLRWTGEPRYDPPDAALRREAGAWRARVDPSRLRGRVAALPGPRNRFDAAEAMARTDALLVDAWRAGGWRTGRQRVILPADPERGRSMPVSGSNLVGIRAGETDEAVVVVAHHDTVRGSPGADDNGAGLAALLELTDLVDAGPRRRTVILATPDFEEVGLVGSRHLVAWLRRTVRVVAAIVYDPIGYMDPTPGSQLVPGGIDLLYPHQVARLDARGRAGDCVVSIYRDRSHALAATWARCLSALVGPDRVLQLRDPLDLPLVGPALGLLPVARNFSRSDHVRFWHAGLPAIQVTDTANFRNPHYHRSTDRPETLDYATLADVVAASALLVDHLATGRMP